MGVLKLTLGNGGGLKLNGKAITEFRYQGPDKYGHYHPGHKKKSDQHGVGSP